MFDGFTVGSKFSGGVGSGLFRGRPARLFPPRRGRLSRTRYDVLATSSGYSASLGPLERTHAQNQNLVFPFQRS